MSGLYEERPTRFGNYNPPARRDVAEEHRKREERIGALVSAEMRETRGVWANPGAAVPAMRPDAPAPHKRAGAECPRCRGSILGDSCLNCGWEYAPAPLPLVDYTGRERQVHRRTNEARL